MKELSSQPDRFGSHTEEWANMSKRANANALPSTKTRAVIKLKVASAKHYSTHGIFSKIVLFFDIYILIVTFKLLISVGLIFLRL